MLRLAALLSLLWPTAASATICAFPERDPALRAQAEARRVAAIPYIIEGEVVADPHAAACGRRGADRIVRVHRVIRGVVPATIRLTVGYQVAPATGCVNSVAEEELDPRLGERGIWALDYRNGEWRLGDICIQTELMRHLARR